MKAKLSVIIPITGINRLEYAKASLHFLNKQTLNKKFYEIILIEQVNCLLGGNRTGGPFYKNIKGIDSYLAIKDPGENHFNQPWMANVGARISTGNKFLFYDIDILAPTTYLESVIEYKHPYFIAWDKMYAMNKIMTEKTREVLEITSSSKVGAELQKSGALEFAGYSVCSRKSFFFRELGGYNENFLGWGGNDNDIAWRALHLMGKENPLKYTLYHQWHQKDYSKNMLWNRRSVWLTTYRNPSTVTERLKSIHVGNPKHQTYINIKDIYVNAKKEKEEKKRRDKLNAK